MNIMTMVDKLFNNNKLFNSNNSEDGNNQNIILFIRGNAISEDPNINGIKYIYIYSSKVFAQL